MPKSSHASLEHVNEDPSALVCRREGAWWPRNKPRAVDAGEDWHRSLSRQEEEKEKPLLLLLLLLLLPLLALIERPLLLHATPLWAREAATEAIV